MSPASSITGLSLDPKNLNDSGIILYSLKLFYSMSSSSNVLCFLRKNCSYLETLEKLKCTIVLGIPHS